MTLAVTNEGSTEVDGIAVDDDGRPIVSVRFDTPLILGGQPLQPIVIEPGAPARGRVFVRLSADLGRIEGIFVPIGKGCTHPLLGELTSMDAHAGSLAITYRFGMSAKCGVKDEGSTVMVFRLLSDSCLRPSRPCRTPTPRSHPGYP